MPTIGPYRSTKGPAQKIDQILPPQEPLFFYSRTRTSALFYTHRKAVVLDFKNLEDLMASEKTVYCIITRKDWDREVKDHTQFARVIFKEGDRMIISNLRKGGDR